MRRVTEVIKTKNWNDKHKNYKRLEELQGWMTTELVGRMEVTRPVKRTWKYGNRETGEDRDKLGIKQRKNLR